MPGPHVLQGPAMKNVHVCFLLSVSLVAASLQLLIYTESAVCEAVSAEGDAFQAILWKMKYSYPYNTTDPCAWPPAVVQCNSSTGPIIGLNFSNMGLSGPIPPEIGLFPSLRTLDFSNYPTNSPSCTGRCNNVLGPIPKELGNLTNLQILLLSRSTLSQSFPPPVLNLTNLIELKIDNCNLSGPIPREISNLSKLQSLFLGNNSLVGPLPELGPLINLQQLTLWGNNISDKIPPQWGNLSNLIYLNLHDNLLWGPLPPELGNLSKLTRMLIYANDLTGTIPDSWTGLTSVSELNIRQNYLSDPFPAWIVSLPSLKTLDISDNQFTGAIPVLNESASLLKAYNGTTQNVDLGANYFAGGLPTNLPANVNITQNCFTGYTEASDSCFTFFENFQGNCPPCPVNFFLYNYSACLCQPSDNPKSTFPVGAVVGGLIGGLALSLALVALYLFKPIDVFDPFAKWKKNYGPWEIPTEVQKYTFSELAKATGNFSEANEIGAGGFGKVFNGTLGDGKMVAIKRASEQSLQGTTEFRNEVLLLSRLHHRHLVRLEGFCDDKGLQILVYEFMSNGNLHDHLVDSEKGKPLSLFTRLEIAVGVAQALDYLHSYADPPVIHRDIKPTNILLDDHFIAKVSDFGISKETPEFNTHVSTRPAGTAGYLDPEYFLRQQLTTASDVYAYGVVLLELITGQKAIDHMRFEEINLIGWVRSELEQPLSIYEATTGCQLGFCQFLWCSSTPPICHMTKTWTHRFYRPTTLPIPLENVLWFYLFEGTRDQRKIIVTFVGCNLYVSESLTKNNACGDDGINGNTDGPWEIPSGVQKYTFSELAKATGNFSEANEIGAGGFGKVFNGTLDDGKMVAIKRASEQSLQGTTEFRNEVLLLSRLHHRHLVRLEGFCDDKGLQILVYEFMSNGNLHDHLVDSEKGKPLSLFTRLEIAVGVAQALDYLHSYADPPVIHRDIKPTNILLDDHFIAKVSDFGISKETPEFNTHVSTRPAGTAGYLDPEYFLRQQLTTASDVYAYGVVLLELITGQKAIDHMRLEEINLIGWVKPRFKEMGVAGIVDPAMGEDYDPQILKVMTEVALMSAASRKNDRPTMK
ncbi:unnamed protein product, partial [Sphagnum balticum]